MSVFTYVLIVLGAVAAYFIGSINTAIIVSKSLSGDDIRDLGSGNAGMTNVLRNYGKKAGILTFVGDAVKGMLSVIIMTLMLKGIKCEDEALIMFSQYIASLFALIGHVFPIYYKFKGGKGVSVSLGSVILFDLPVAFVCLIGFIIVFLITKMVSAGSVCAAILLPISTIIFDVFVIHTNKCWLNVLVALLMAIVIILKHQSNIKRILNGTESKFSGHKGE